MADGLIVYLYFSHPIEKALCYHIENKLAKNISLYQRVHVDLNQEKVIGIITDIKTIEDYKINDNSYPIEKLKSVLRLIDKEPILNQEQYSLAIEISTLYLCSVGEALFLMIPSGKRSSTGLENELLESPISKDIPPLLEAQQKIVTAVLQADSQKRQAHLIFGITGSGKTRVYLELILEYLARGLGVIFLLPEIALSYQFLEQLKPIFQNNMAILHSGLSKGERLRQYRSVLSGQVSLVVGTRSAIFSPIRNLGLVILDEEHDASYKEHSSPRYHTRRIAWLRLQHSLDSLQNLNLAPSLVLGSATPSIESYYLANKKAIHLHLLKNRATGQSLPDVHVPTHNAFTETSPLFSLFLKEKIEKTLAKGEQVLLLLNRRGHSSYAFCPKCEESIGCPHCSVTLTYHSRYTKYDVSDVPMLKCHLCGFTQNYSKQCPTCHGLLNLLGKGTQRVEENIEKLFPNISYSRLDQDTTRNKDFSKEIIAAMRNREIQILVGTQMIAKGFDLPGVTLVGILNADIGLTLPDFRAAERVFQLLIQASGRAGRHAKGEVVMQTAQPSHYAISCALGNHYETFATEELKRRKELNYPPFTRLFRFVFKSENEENVIRYSKLLDAYIKEIQQEDSLFSSESPLPEEILGPVQTPIYQIKKYYRMHLLAKSNNLEAHNLLARRLKAFHRKHAALGVKDEIDFDPLDLL